jgi:hypothetical protein
MKVDPIDGVASRVHGFRPKALGGLELSKHRPRHIDERPVLPLYHTILLWCVGSVELVLDPFLLKELLHLRPCSFNPKTIGIEGDWKGLERILTCRGFNPPQSLWIDTKRTWP